MHDTSTCKKQEIQITVDSYWLFSGAYQKFSVAYQAYKSSQPGQRKCHSNLQTFSGKLCSELSCFIKIFNFFQKFGSNRGLFFKKMSPITSLSSKIWFQYWVVFFNGSNHEFFFKNLVPIVGRFFLIFCSNNGSILKNLVPIISLVGFSYQMGFQFKTLVGLQ